MAVLQQILGAVATIVIEQFGKAPAQGLEPPGCGAFEHMLHSAEIFPAGAVGQLRDQVIADLVQQGGFAVVLRLFQHVDQGLFQ
ncbi:hypothetical protein D3C80_1933940 [compost metagenome]